MATLTADGQSFSLNNRRLWIVGAEIGYAGIAPEHWRDRFRAAKRAGFNTAVVPAVWAVHEPVRGGFRFDEENDLAAFCRTAGEEGLWVILRIGPVTSGSMSLGGMPSWLLGALGEGERLRTNDPGFLRAVSAYYAAAAKRIAPLQATLAGDGEDDPRRAGHPLLAVQTEHQWNCGDQGLAASYLDALTRFLREGKVTVPILNLNNMYAEAEGAIETWSGYGALHTVTRQIRTAWPDEPAVIGALRAATPDVWGESDPGHKTPVLLERVIAEVLSAAGQFCIADVAPSAPRGFMPGRYAHAQASWATAAPPRGIIAEDGSPGPAYHAVRRICSFASSFGGVFANAEIDAAAVTLSPSTNVRLVVDERTGERATGRPLSPGYSVHEVRGSAGSVAFVLGDPDAKGARPPAVLTLPTGIELRVELGKLPLAWVLLDAHLHTNQRLDFSTFSVFTLVGDSLVVFGSGGARGLVSINGSSVPMVAPTGKAPVVERIDGTTVVLCNEHQIDAAFISGDAVYIGATAVEHADASEGDGSDPPESHVFPAAGFTRVTVVERGGDVRTVTAKSARGSRPRVALGDWSCAPATQHMDGSSDRYARFDGPASFESVGTPHGYAWVRTALKASQAKRSAKLGFFQLADRACVSIAGAAPLTVGLGPGAPGLVVPYNLAKGESTLVALVDNMGRFCEGFDMAEPKGLYGHVYRVEQLKAKAEQITASPLDLLDNSTPLTGVVSGDTTHPDRLSWSFVHRRKTPVILHLSKPDWVGLVLLNGDVVARLIPGRPLSVVMNSEMLKRGNNEVQIAIFGDDDYVAESIVEVKKAVALYEGVETLTDGSTFAMAGWEAPPGSAYEPVAKTGLGGAAAKARRGMPAWWRSSFRAPAEPVQLSVGLVGMSKGQMLVNGHNVCRYWVATGDGAPVPPADTYAIPSDLIMTGEDNELVLFDEHGFSPAKAIIKAGPING